MYYHLNPESICTFGKEECLIQNVNSGKLFTFESKYSCILKCIENCESIYEIIKKYPLEDIKSLIKYLNRHKLGCFYNSKVFIDKIRPINIKETKFISERRFKLKKAVVELTGRCNLDCMFCTEDKVIYRTCGCKKWSNINELGVPEWLHILAQLISFNVEEVVFSGGEPLLRWELMKTLMTELHKHNIRISIYTNLILLNEEIAQYLKDVKAKLYVQMLGSNEQSFDGIINQEGSFRKLLHNINMSDRNGINIIPIILVNNANYMEVNGIIDLIGNRPYLLRYLYKSNEMYAESKEKELYCVENKLIYFNKNNYQIPYIFNCCLYGQVFISGDARVYPCMMLRDFQLGDLNKEQLWEVFRRKEYKSFWELTKDEISKCGECELRYNCNDCRALEYYETKDIKGMYYCNH